MSDCINPTISISSDPSGLLFPLHERGRGIRPDGPAAACDSGGLRVLCFAACGVDGGQHHPPPRVVCFGCSAFRTLGFAFVIDDSASANLARK